MKKNFYMLSSLMICLLTSCEKAEDSVIDPSRETIPTYVDTEDYVDLGFGGLLFATKNLGAKSPEESGHYFAWGEVQPKSNYNWKSYKWAEPTTEHNYVYGNITFSKYKDIGDNQTKTDYEYLQPEDDAATVILGEGWRTPTLDEMWYLTSCESRKTVKNGVFGYEYIGPNGNSLFLPSCGLFVNNDHINVECGAKYWCSDCPKSNVASIIDINESGYAWSGIESRYLGLPIRPVRTEKASILNGLKYNILEKYIEQAQKLLETIQKDDYSISSYQTFEHAYNHAVDIRAIETKEKILPSNPQDSINKAAKELHLAIMDLDKLPKPSDIKAVDLGLSVRWASANIGARNEDENGYYISWGELTPKPIGYYRWDDYKLCKEVNEGNNDYSQLTKYVTDSQWGDVDNKTRLDIEDDAANAYLGGNWRIPTKEEFLELVDKCTINEVIRQGAILLKVTGPNGNCIYFPYAGYARWQDRIVFEVFCWTSDLYPDFPTYAYGFNLTPHNKPMLLTNRIDGLTIRAVCP